MTGDDAVAFLARHLVTGWHLHTAHRDGVAAAVKRLAADGRGGGGHGRHYSVDGGKARLWIGPSGGEPVAVLPVRVLIEWALARLGDDEADELARLIGERGAAVGRWDDLTRRTPRERLTPTDLATVRAAEVDQYRAEHAIREVADRVLARDDTPAVGQLDLFAAAVPA